MANYPRIDPYQASRYDQGIDAKIVIMGNTGVGKTSLLHRYTQHRFDPKNTTSTTGAFFVTKKVFVDGVRVRLQLWDTAGQERFRSMAPMYYRGANAALLLYDITNTSSFDDIRGWLEELKSNCSPDLIIYIVGSKADLHRYRQVTSDLARLSLHTWFPPERPLPLPPSPPPPPPSHLSTFSYIRPRFTSFTSSRSSPPTPPYPSESPPEPHSQGLRPSGLRRAPPPTGGGGGGGGKRSNKPSTALLTSSKLVPTGRGPRPGSHFLFPAGGHVESDETSSNSVNEEGEDTFEADSEEWGLREGMELFEVSAKDDTGVDHLFDSLICTIIARKDKIGQENETKKRDSVMISSDNAPTWSSQAEEEEIGAAKTGYSKFGWNTCCS